MKQRSIYALMTGGGVIGMVAAFLQLLEVLALEKNKDAVLACNLSSTFSCSNVLNAWQSSVFGFPNSIMCLTIFTVLAVAGLAGLTGSKLSRGFRLGMQGLALFTLGFGLWTLFEDTYAIGSLCIFCLVCFAGLLAVNGTWLRINAADLPVGRGRIQRAIGKGADIFGWFVLAAIVAFAMVLRFA